MVACLVTVACISIQILHGLLFVQRECITNRFLLRHNKTPETNVYHLPCTPQSHPYYSKCVYTIDLDREQLFRKGKIG